MENNNAHDRKTFFVTRTAAVVVISFFAVFCAVLSIYLFKFLGGIIAEHRIVFSGFVIALFFFAAVVGNVFVFKNKTGGYRAIIIALIILFFVLLALCFVYATGLMEHVSTVEELREFISSFGANAVLIMLAFQILQVVILPVPGVVAVGATVALFGAFKGALISLIGILIGSFIAFYIGRSLGYRAASWVVGEKSLEKVLQKVKGKDKAVLTVMFVFPFFPDDVLCFVAGLSTMSAKFFSVMIIIARIISVFTTAYSLDGNIIPYNTWWGILIWAVLIAAVGGIAYLVYKKGETIEKRIIGFFKKRKKERV